MSVRKIIFNKGGNTNNVKEFEVPQQHLDLTQNRIEPSEEKVKLAWKYIGDPTDIVETKPGCGCTVNVEYVGNEVIAYFYDDAVTTKGKKITPDDKQKGYFDITKSLRIFLDDGLPLKVRNGLSNKYNNNKAHIKIMFTVRVNLLKMFPYQDPSPKKNLNK